MSGGLVLDMSWTCSTKVLCVRQTKTKHTNGFHNAMLHTNSATGSTMLSTLLTKSEYCGTISIALTINTSLGLEKIGLQC